MGSILYSNYNTFNALVVLTCYPEHMKQPKYHSQIVRPLALSVPFSLPMNILCIAYIDFAPPVSVAAMAAVANGAWLTGMWLMKMVAKYINVHVYKHINKKRGRRDWL